MTTESILIDETERAETAGDARAVWPASPFSTERMEEALARLVRDEQEDDTHLLRADLAAFVEGLPRLDARLLTGEVPEDFPEPPLARRAMAAAAQLFALARAGERLQPAEVRVDADALRAHRAAADRVMAEVQAACDRLVQAGQIKALKELARFRQLVAAQEALVRRAAARLRGEVRDEVRTALVDLQEKPEIRLTPSPRTVPPPARPRREQSKPVTPATTAHPNRGRIIAGLVCVALLALGAWAGSEPETVRLAPTAFEQLPDVFGMQITARHALVRVVDGWTPGSREVSKLQGELYVMGVVWMKVVDRSGTVLFDGPTERPQPPRVDEEAVR